MLFIAIGISVGIAYLIYAKRRVNKYREEHYDTRDAIDYSVTFKSKQDNQTYDIESMIEVFELIGTHLKINPNKIKLGDTIELLEQCETDAREGFMFEVLDDISCKYKAAKWADYDNVRIVEDIIELVNIYRKYKTS